MRSLVYTGLLCAGPCHPCAFNQFPTVVHAGSAGQIIQTTTIDKVASRKHSRVMSPSAQDEQRGMPTDPVTGSHPRRSVRLPHLLHRLRGSLEQILAAMGRASSACDAHRGGAARAGQRSPTRFGRSLEVCLGP